MTTVDFHSDFDVPLYVVRSSTRMLYVLLDNTVVDPFMIRQDSAHANLDDAIAVATAYVNMEI